MKAPWVLTAVILAAAAFLGAGEHKRLAVLREKHRLVLRDAAALGVSTDLSKPYVVTKATKRSREDAAAKVQAVSDALASFAREMKDQEKNGAEPDEAAKKRVFQVFEDMMSLSGEEMKLLIAGLRERTDMDDEMKKNMLGFSIMMLAQQHPEKALALFTETSDLLKDNPLSSHVLSSALSQWAKDDPLAAAEWIKKNAEKHPDLVKGNVKEAVIAGAARTDIGLAFQLLGELKLDLEDSNAIHRIAGAADTPERQAEFLAALRKQVAATKDKKQADAMNTNGIVTLFSQVSKDGFEKSVAWLEHGGLSPEEQFTALQGLGYHQTKADTGKWLDWMAARGEGDEKLKNSAGQLVRQWTREDYKAAGEWLAGSPEGPVKEEATLSYLQTVAPYDPDVAAQWAETLKGERKTDSLKSILRTLKNKDKAAAEEFAKRHGLEKK